MKIIYIVTKNRKSVIKLEGSIKIFEEMKKYYIRTYDGEDWVSLGSYQSLNQARQILLDICMALSNPNNEVEIYPMPLK